MSARDSVPPRIDGGFSLVETVAAMGILALAAIPLLQISTDATRNSQYLEKRLLARTVAENVMARVISDPVAPSPGVERGIEVQLGRSFEWTQLATPVASNGLQSITVEVMLAGETQPLASFEALKLSASEPLSIDLRANSVEASSQ